MSSSSSVLTRKADLRELKVLQKVENRQYQDLVVKSNGAREQQLKKFEQDMQVEPAFGNFCALIYSSVCHGHIFLVLFDQVLLHF